MLTAPDPAPVEFRNSASQANFLLVCDHAGRAIPQALDGLGLAPWVMERHVAWDIGAAALTGCLSQSLNAPAILGVYSRLVVDLNRQPDLATAIPQVSDGIAIPGNLQLDEAQRRQRLEDIFWPYHRAIDARLAAMQPTGAVPALISIHTFTPSFDRQLRPWHVGVLWDLDDRIAAPLLANLRRIPGLCVGDNEPYSGRHPLAYTVDSHAGQRGWPGVGIEVRQDLVADPAGAGYWAGILGRALRPILDKSAL